MIPELERSLEKEMATHSNNYKTEYLRFVLFYINMTFENKNSMVSEYLVKGECLVLTGH